MAAKPPPSAAKAFAEIRKVLKMDWIEFPPTGFGGNGAPGRMLEHICNIAENNNDSPDLADWELKFHGGSSLITLFHKDPLPKGAINKIVNDYGWDDDHGRISFRHTLSGESDRGFKVKHANNDVCIFHKDTIEPIATWSHNDIMILLGAKLRRLILVEGKMKTTPRSVKYNTATAFWNPDLNHFIQALETGKVSIDFDARTKAGRGSAIRNHGTKFRVHRENLAAIYLNSVEIEP